MHGQLTTSLLAQLMCGDINSEHLTERKRAKNLHEMAFNSVCIIFFLIIGYSIGMAVTVLINMDENSQEFLVELERRIKLAKNPKNRIPLEQANKNIIEKYTKLIS